MARRKMEGFSLNNKDVERMKEMKAEYGVTGNTEFLRKLLHDSPRQEPGRVRNNLLTSYVIRDIVQQLGIRQPSVKIPPQSIDCLELALIIAKHHADQLRAGVIPLTPTDIQEYGLDVHGRRVWELYNKEILNFFSLILGQDGMRIDLRYDPIQNVNGEYAGAVQGEVMSMDYYYIPGTTRQMKILVVFMDRVGIKLYALTDICPNALDVGVTVFAAGVFGVEGRKLVMEVSKITLLQGEG